MISNAVLWVPHPEMLLERVGGLTVLERHLWTATRAGLSKLWIGARKPPEDRLARLRLPPELEVHWSQREGDASRECQTPYLMLSGDHFVRVESLRYVATAGYTVPATLEDAAGVAVVQVVPYRSDRVQAPHKQPLPPGASVFLETPVAAGPALGWLLASAVRGQDGFMARHFDRHLSLAVSRLLVDLPFPPTLMTVLSTLIGVTGTLFFLTADQAHAVAGACLVWLHSMLDGCDGELARMRFQESALGADLDFWGDNLVHLSLFSCLAAGFSQADHSPLPLLLGAAACLGSLGSALIAFKARLVLRRRQAAGSPPADGLGQALDWLAQRDFIYLLLVLAYLGRTYEFLWAAAVGALLFFILMLFHGGVQHAQAIPQHPSR